MFLEETPVSFEKSWSMKLLRDSPAGCGGSGRTASGDDDPEAAAYGAPRKSGDANPVARAMKVATSARRRFIL